MNNHIWHPEDGSLLQQLRISAQLDELVFARSNAISLAQLRELEGRGQGSFYTAHIKSHTGYKLLRKLGHEPVVRAPVLAVPEVEEPLAMTEQTLMPKPARLPVSSDTMLVPNTAPALTTEPSASMPEQDTTKHHPLSSGWLMQPTRVFSLLLLTAGVWAVVNTPWASLIARMSPETNDTFAKSIVATTTPNKIHPGVHPHNAEPNAVPTTISHTPAPQSTLDTLGAATTQTPPAAELCDWRHQASSFVYEPSEPVKAGNYIHFVAVQDGNVCVRDQQNRLTTLQLKAGMAKSIYGEPPFLVHSPSWASLQLFYQGRRVMGTPSGEAYWVFKNKALSAQGLTMSMVMGQTRP
jgi:hypothetical protein